jgi:lipoprotein-anchoring transpeptidase ErfK/SrfK
MPMQAAPRILLLVVLGIFLVSGCDGPPIPQEMRQAEVQELDLWKIGGPSFAPQEYQRYVSALRKAKDDLIQEGARVSFLRDYGKVQARFQALLQEGEGLRASIASAKQARKAEVDGQVAACRAKLEKLRQLASVINEGYLAGIALTRAELVLAETVHLSEQGELDSARERLKSLNGFVTAAREILAPIVARYTDQALIAKWRRWAAETVAESQRRGKIAIVVSKMDRLLYLYRGGDLLKTYPVGIGRYGASLKLRAGDSATPEGKYSIIQKRPHSRYEKALLINYPNGEDREEFAAAKRRGQIPRASGIGGAVEIHGGGKDGMTFGCIALDNTQMEELFDTAEVGTPVTIVGLIDPKNAIASALAGL